jgi:hypothetical protein
MAIGWGPLESFATAAGTVLAALGMFGKSQKHKGVLEQKLKDIDKKLTDDISTRLHDHDLTIAEHSTTLAQHDGSFKVIDNKLDNLKEGQVQTQALIGKLADKIDSAFEVKK